MEDLSILVTEQLHREEANFRKAKDLLDPDSLIVDPRGTQSRSVDYGIGRIMASLTQFSIYVNSINNLWYWILLDNSG